MKLPPETSMKLPPEAAPAPFTKQSSRLSRLLAMFKVRLDPCSQRARLPGWHRFRAAVPPPQSEEEEREERDSWLEKQDTAARTAGNTSSKASSMARCALCMPGCGHSWHGLNPHIGGCCACYRVSSKAWMPGSAATSSKHGSMAASSPQFQLASSEGAKSGCRYALPVSCATLPCLIACLMQLQPKVLWAL
jgi:hypothetical protein